MARLIDADELRECFEPADFDNDDGFENCWNAVRITDAAPTIDAIPVEWLEGQIRPYTGDVSDIGKSTRNATIKDLIRKWQKEQEART